MSRYLEEKDTIAGNDPSDALGFDVPLVLDDDYIALLNDHHRRIHSLHFSLYSEHAADARHRFETVSAGILAQALAKIRGPRKYALLNSRFLAPDRYFDRTFMNSLVELLGTLVQDRVLDGIVFSDAYLLQALNQADPDTMSLLEAIPSINFMLDDFDKTAAVVDLIAGTRFRLPEKIVLDRSLNRRMDRLVRTADQCRRAFPGLKIGLLANEGCLYQCPFKLAHDAHIALANQTNGPVMTFQTNEDFGCRRAFGRAPWRFFTSPFIRPEDLGHYHGIVDFIKLCGRTLGPGFLTTALKAYVTGRYQGNLPALMDTTNWMADLIHLPNHLLGDAFFSQVTGCDRQCESCGYCQALYDRLARSTGTALPDFRSGPDLRKKT